MVSGMNTLSIRTAFVTITHDGSSVSTRQCLEFEYLSIRVELECLRSRVRVSHIGISSKITRTQCSSISFA